MEKLFNKEDLSKVKTGSFNIKSLKYNGKYVTACSFYRDCAGNILTAYSVKYEVSDSEVEYVFISFAEKVSGKSMEDSVNSSRKYLRNKHEIIIDSRGIGHSVIDILANDYVTDEGVLYKGIKKEIKYKKFPQKVIELPVRSNNIHIAIMKLRELIQNGRFHIDEKLYKEIIDELSLVEYETKDNMIIKISCDKKEYLDNILMICELMSY